MFNEILWFGSLRKTPVFFTLVASLISLSSLPPFLIKSKVTASEP